MNDIKRVEKEIQFLREYLTEERKQKIENVLNNRTRQICVILEDIYHSHNASAVIRTCDCFGIQDLHVIENLKRNRINKGVAQGAGKWVTIKNYTKKENNTESCFSYLKREGYRIVGTALEHPELIDIDNLPLNEEKIALCFGCEELGMSEKALGMVDDIIKIPMYGFTQSFNVSVSVAISLQLLTRKLHDSAFKWRLNEKEKLLIEHEWVKSSVKNANILLKRFKEV